MTQFSSLGKCVTSLSMVPRVIDSQRLSKIIAEDEIIEKKNLTVLMAYKNGPQTFNQSEQGGVSICLLIMLTVNLELTLPKIIDYKFAVPLSELS